MSKNNISFILHKPQLSENIGACARAIKNFNFKKLVLINSRLKILDKSSGCLLLVTVDSSSPQNSDSHER